MTQIDLAKQIAFLAHEGHFRRDGVTPYTEHLRRVADLCSLKGEMEICTAWLHDVIEDTHVSSADLAGHGVDKYVIEAVCAITRRRHEDYDTYTERLSRNQTARRVKLADMLDNLTDSPSETQKRRYLKTIMRIYGQ